MPINTGIEWLNATSYNVINWMSKGFPYSLPSVGSGADPGIQAVGPQVTITHPPSGRLPLLSARPAITYPAAEHHHPLAGTHFTVPRRVEGWVDPGYWTQPIILCQRIDWLQTWLMIYLQLEKDQASYKSCVMLKCWKGAACVWAVRSLDDQSLRFNGCETACLFTLQPSTRFVSIHVTASS